MMTITRTYEISSAHHLPLHEGKCRQPHGHSYIIEVSVTGSLQEEGPATGMVMDFADLDSVVEPILARLDHKDLNEVLVFAPTAENICSYIAVQVRDELRKNQKDKGMSLDEILNPHVPHLQRVRVYETRNSYVEATQ